MTDVFISYTRDERARCVRIAEALRAYGLDVWFDAKLTSGMSFDREIEERVRAAKAVMVLWSPKSVESNWVRNEATIGQQRDVLVSVEIAPCTLPIAFTNTHTEFLHDTNLTEANPAWTNILGRLADLTQHSGLAAHRNAEPRPTRRRGKFPIALALMGFVVIAGGAIGAWVMTQNPAAPVETADIASTTTIGSTPTTGDPEADRLARLVVGQWAISRSDCPAHTPGAPVDMTPSTGAWFTMQYESGSIRASSGGTTVLERIVGAQNGWLRTTSASDDMFYRVDEAGRLLLRVGGSEPTRLEPCI